MVKTKYILWFKKIFFSGTGEILCGKAPRQKGIYPFQGTERLVQIEQSKGWPVRLERRLGTRFLQGLKAFRWDFGFYPEHNANLQKNFRKTI